MEFTCVQFEQGFVKSSGVSQIKNHSGTGVEKPMALLQRMEGLQFCQG